MSMQESLRAPGWRHRLGFLALNVGGWVLVSAIVSVWLVTQRRQLGVPTVGWRLFANTLQYWAFWTIPTWFVFRTFRRHSLEPGRWRRTLGIHVLASIAWMPIYGLLLIPRSMVAFDIPLRHFFKFAPEFFGTMFWLEYLLYWPVFAVAAAYDGLRRARDREVLGRELAQARLDALRSRIQPHFLFNTLAAISGLLRSGDVERSARSVELLADLLRRVVSQSDRPLVRLEEELATADLYLAIQKIRCGPRLAIDVSVDPQAMPVGVPNLLLQPLLENAFEHGVSRVPGPVEVTLVARREANRLEIEITNPTAASAGREPAISGLGLANTRSRVELLFPNEGRCDLVLEPAARLARTLVSLPAREVQ